MDYGILWKSAYLAHSVKKGGSTRYILTDALYAEDLEGTQIAAAIFFYPLDLLESRKLTSSLNLFEKNLLKDKAFREKTIQVISSEGVI
jgi:D-alanyl-D-alanine carboxypeptidase